MKTKIGVLALLSLFIVSIMVFSQNAETIKVEFNVKGFNDVDYPSNPDIGFRSATYKNNFFKKGFLTKNGNSFYNITFETTEKGAITLNNLDLSSWVPTIPDTFQENEYLTQLSLVNQEWNRNQVSFSENNFITNFKKIKRIDLAKNCLNSYLWEVIVYTEENKSILPYAHGWFNFPENIYQDLFFENNHRPFQDFVAYLEQWKTPESKEIKKESLRKEIENVLVDYEDLSDSMYALSGERAKKRNEIIYPISFSSMRELQTDSTQFATFSPPGMYNKASPRKTELGRIFKLDSIILRKSEKEGTAITPHEIEMIFSDKNKDRVTKLILGGLDFSEIKTLSSADAHKGWQNSMGFGNHTFYEPYTEHLMKNSKDNPYYGYLTDERDKWLDSHKVGIDGPLLHFDNTSKNKLHIWLLSFERHALVGHYTIEWEE